MQQCKLRTHNVLLFILLASLAMRALWVVKRTQRLPGTQFRGRKRPSLSALQWYESLNLTAYSPTDAHILHGFNSTHYVYCVCFTWAGTLMLGSFSCYWIPRKTCYMVAGLQSFSSSRRVRQTASDIRCSYFSGYSNSEYYTFLVLEETVLFVWECVQIRVRWERGI